MSRLVISDDARSEDLAAIALALNEVVRLPVTMPSSKYPGVRAEPGQVLDKNYSAPVLKEVFGNYVDVVRQVARPGTERNEDPQS